MNEPGPGINPTDVKESAQDIKEVLMERGEEYGFDAINNIAGILRILYPKGIASESYDELVASMHIVLKLVRYTNEINEGSIDIDSAKDLGGYGTLLYALELSKRRVKIEEGPNIISLEDEHKNIKYTKSPAKTIGDKK